MRRRQPARIVIVSSRFMTVRSIEEAGSRGVNHGKRGDIPRGPATYQSGTSLRQRTLELGTKAAVMGRYRLGHRPASRWRQWTHIPTVRGASQFFVPAAAQVELFKLAESPRGITVAMQVEWSVVNQRQDVFSLDGMAQAVGQCGRCTAGACAQ